MRTIERGSVGRFRTVHHNRLDADQLQRENRYKCQSMVATQVASNLLWSLFLLRDRICTEGSNAGMIRDLCNGKVDEATTALLFSLAWLSTWAECSRAESKGSHVQFSSNAG